MAGRPVARVSRALASPIGVVVTVPLLVVAVGVGILLLGRDATRSSRNQLVETQLRERADEIKAQVELALDQASPLLARTRVIARARAAAMLTDAEVLVRLHDLIIGRFGVAYLSISFPDGSYFQANATSTGIEVQDSKLGPTGTLARWFRVDGDRLVPLREQTTAYDPRKRPFYALAARGKRAWTEPYPFYLSGETGITCTEPVLGGDGALDAVLTVDFNVNALSTYVARPALDQARSIVYAGDGVILASPSITGRTAAQPDALLHHTDLHDPALDALFATAAGAPRFRELATGDGAYLASVTPIAGRRAGVTVPLDWYVATIVPVQSLLGPTKRLERDSVIASAIALAIAVGLAIILAWNLVRMRRQVAASREEARSAVARARDLGAYRLVAKLGAGGMGEVWRAEHRMLARSAAIKLIRPEALHDPEGVEEIRERFRREAQTLASMRSRHTTEIYDYGVTELGVFYYVMELLDGVDLESLVVRYGAQPPARVIALMIQACSSLAEAHDAGLLHRDIKPPNLFVSRAADEVDVVKLLDFGIVQSLEDPEATRPLQTIAPGPIPESQKLTQLGAMLGTPGFMAPEQILGMPLDGRADLYALGCVAWWLLAGNEVFRRDGADAKLLHRHVYDPIPSLVDAVPGWCPAELEDVIAACLAKEVDRRPTNARELAARLRAIPIPDEHAWTEARAQAWWAEYRAPAPTPKLATDDVQVIMPGATEQRPVAATSDAAIGPTVVQSGRGR